MSLKRNFNTLEKWIGAAILLLLCITLSYFVSIPLIPIEGDAFGCWYEYALRLGKFKFSEALLGADGPGRYPGFPIAIAGTMASFGQPYLESLRILRIININITALFIFLNFRIIKLSFLESALATAAFLSIPNVWANIGLNTQDSAKIMLMSVGIFCTAGYFNGRNSMYLIGAVLTALGLVSLRATEVLPFFAFFFVYAKSQGGLDTDTRRADLNIFFGVNLIALIALHIGSWLVIGRGGFSGTGGHTHVWLKSALKAARHFDGNSAVELIRLIGVAVINKAHYFADDFFFSVRLPRIVDADQFVTHVTFQPTALNATVAFAGLFCFVLIFYIYLSRDATALLKAVAASGATTAGFYTFGLNHYEPRYWLIFAFCSFYLLVAWLKHLGRSSAQGFALSAVLLFSTMLGGAFSVDRFRLNRSLHVKSLAQSEKWIEDLKLIHDQKLQYVVIPHEFYTWSSFRYFSNRSFPELKIIDQKFFNLNQGSNGWRGEILDNAHFNDTAIIGL